MENIIRERSNMYALLSRTYRVEADKEFLEKMRTFDWQTMGEGWNQEMQQACALMANYTKNYNSNTELDLARDFTRCFFGAGLPRGGGAYPYESVYTSKERIKAQDAMDQVIAVYAEEGLVRAETYTEPADQLSIELEFMSYLCEQCLQAIEQKDFQKVDSYIKKQETFLKTHLLNWVPMFCKDLEEIAEQNFYKAAAVITSSFLKEDYYFLEELAAEKMS